MALDPSNPPRMDYAPPTSGDGTLTPSSNEQPEENAQPDVLPSAVPFGILKQTHEEYDGEYWKICRALYKGGRALLRNSSLLKHVFPQHRNEAQDIYAERLKRAFYIDYPGEIVDYIVASLMGSPIELMPETEPDPYYADFFEDTSPPGGRRRTVNQLLREQILSALLVKRAWTQVDFPRVSDDEFAAMSQAEQEAIGALDAYAIPLDESAVLDWEEDGTGELVWAKTCVATNPRASVTVSRHWVTKTFTIYTRDRWARYVVRYHKDKEPKDSAMVPVQDQGEHSFGKVPLLRLELPDSLWVMNKLCSLAVEFFNKRCALSWAEYKSLFQERYEFEGEPDPLASPPAIADDEERSLNQVHGIGYTQVRYSKDRVEYIGPDSSPFEVALKSLKDLRDEMHRVTHQMALTFDNGPAALGRSADSKAQDKAANAVVLVGLGEYVRDHAFDIASTISYGRQDDLEWTASGMNKFESQGVSSMIEDAEKLENVNIPSPTFKLRQTYELAKRILGDEASEEDMAKVEAELERAFTEESMSGQFLNADGQLVGETVLIDSGGEDTSGAPPSNGQRGFASNPQPT